MLTSFTVGTCLKPSLGTATMAKSITRMTCITQGLLTLTSFIVGTGLDALTQCDKDKTAYYDVYHFVTDNLDVI